MNKFIRAGFVSVLIVGLLFSLHNVASATTLPTTVFIQLTPTSGPVGTIVQIVGDGLTPQGNTVNFGTTTIPNLPAVTEYPPGRSYTQILFTIPSSLISCQPFTTCTLPALQPGSYPISVTNANGTSNSVNFTLTSTTQDQSYTLTVGSTTSNSGHATITSDPSGINCRIFPYLYNANGGGGTEFPHDCSKTFPSNTFVAQQVILTATPATNATFVKWTDDCSAYGKSPQITFTISKNMNCNALVTLSTTNVQKYTDASFGFSFDYLISRTTFMDMNNNLAIKDIGSTSTIGEITFYKGSDYVDIGNAHNGHYVISYNNGWIATNDEGDPSGSVTKTIAPIAYTNSGLPIFASIYNSCSLPYSYAVALSHNKFISVRGLDDGTCTGKSYDTDNSETFKIIKSIGGTPGDNIYKYVFKRILKVGARGDDVKAIQSVIGVTSDGVYGKGTASKVKLWQKDHGLPADGVFGAKSAAKLNSNN